MTIKKIFIIAFCFSLAACGSTSGAKVSQEQTSQFIKGKTTMDQVVATLGKPNTKTTKDDGDTLLQYVYANTTVRGATFIPFVGLFAGGADIETEVSGFTFDKNGVLKEVTKRESNHGSSLSGSNN
ncbi:outer membrane protein assembly factor BamE [Polynucleobacter sp. AP-RePozz3-80-G7]|uniref:outer membrane protein assembly factor BamE domain-containing protein n=1 Tax=Polynucleobacter sp. AP-RePozz3-80-G7 TaxID=2689105 RepID=UPI001C0DF9B5|nr:outer membrane protein assembly factor BamE [Polynucleobacter sp. AP-RePozz3-80-G7]MBU3639993.1 outer membrane protein assembly factor BamE [Polynucleobacter sp. AP-RePozz3-80-G7]